MYTSKRSAPRSGGRSFSKSNASSASDKSVGTQRRSRSGGPSRSSGSRNSSGSSRPSSSTESFPRRSFSSSSPSRSSTGSREGSSFSSSHRPSSGGSSFGRNSNSSSRPFSRSSGVRGRGGSRRNGGGGKRGERIDISKFINKSENIELTPEYVPTHKFADFVIENVLKDSIIKKGFVNPTIIQDQAIPPALKGSDVVGIADTGSGKTAAFLIPTINKMLKDRKQQAIILAPTRELAIQIENELRKFVEGLGITSVTCVGGMPIGRQISQLYKFQNFIIGTPGRLKDLIDRKKINLSTFNTIVLDEADRMLDMGFIDDMRFLMGMMPAERQTLFFSATLSSDIERLIGEFLNKPITISVKSRDTSKNVDQDIVRVPRGKNKIEVLHELLIKPDFEKVIIFGKTKHGVEQLAKDLITRGFKAESIHGDKNHGRRQFALRTFTEGRSQVLVATDVAARGLDISGVSHVINYEIPQTYTDYIHRIGRTGRGNKKGFALTFVDEGIAEKSDRGRTPRTTGGHSSGRNSSGGGYSRPAFRGSKSRGNSQRGR